MGKLPLTSKVPVDSLHFHCKVSVYRFVSLKMGGSLSLTTPSSNRKVEPEGDTVDCAISKMTNNQKSPKRKNLSLAGIEQLNESLQELKEETQNISDINITQYDFQFENLAFEGGGVKGISFLGCIKVSLFSTALSINFILINHHFNCSAYFCNTC